MARNNEAKLREIQLRYRDVAGGLPGGAFLLSPQRAISFIDECVAEGFIPLSIEGFFLHPGGGIQPSMEHSIDIEDTGLSQPEFVEEAKSYIEKRASIPWIHFGFLFDCEGGHGYWVGEPPSSGELPSDDESG